MTFEKIKTAYFPGVANVQASLGLKGFLGLQHKPAFNANTWKILDKPFNLKLPFLEQCHPKAIRSSKVDIYGLLGGDVRNPERDIGAQVRRGRHGEVGGILMQGIGS